MSVQIRARQDARQRSERIKNVPRERAAGILWNSTDRDRRCVSRNKITIGSAIGKVDGAHLASDSNKEGVHALSRWAGVRMIQRGGRSEHGKTPTDWQSLTSVLRGTRRLARYATSYQERGE